MTQRPVRITQYRWAGTWGPFTIKVPCGECTLSQAIIKDVIERELADIPTVFEVHDWLTEWYKPLLKGGWHAPIIMVDGSIISQGSALNRGLLIQAVIEAHVRHNQISGNHLFGKQGCPYCHRARENLKNAEIPYTYHDVVQEPRALYEMLARVKPLIGSKTPVTVPQIWINGAYIGGSDKLIAFLKQ